jgi:hypothetical protein
MRLGKYEYTSDTYWFKLMKRTTDNSQNALVSNLFHERLKLINRLDAYTVDASDEVLHYSSFKNVWFFYTMNGFTIIDDELGVIRDGSVYHVFERENLGRAAYNYMINWIQTNKDPVGDDVDVMWSEAEVVWKSLSPEVYGLLMSIAEKEHQQNKDIHDGLLATLQSYQGVKHVKDAFANAIRSCAW